MFVKSIVLAATAAATLFTVASAAACADSAAEIAKLVPILNDPNVGTCTTDSGYNLLSPSGLPDAATTAKMCASSACTALIKAVIALNPSDCDISLGTVSLNVGALTGSFESDCAKLSTTAPPASTTASPSTTTATPSTTDAPSTTTAAPSTTDAPSTTTASPNVTTAAPTPADNAC